MDTFFWNSPSPAESLKTIKPFDGIFLGFGHFGSQIDSTNSGTHAVLVHRVTGSWPFSSLYDISFVMDI